MRISQGLELILHCCALLAEVPTGRALPSAKLTEFFGVPKPYLAKQLQALSRAGILRTGFGAIRALQSIAPMPRAGCPPERRSRYGDEDVARIREANDFSERRLLATALAQDLSGVRRLDVPIVLFSGRSDYVVNAGLAEERLTRLRAPYKCFVWFEQLGHDVFIEEPGRALVSLVPYVLPLARRRRDDPRSSTPIRR